MPNTQHSTVDTRFSSAARFAIYYAPAAASAWWEAGCAWLQRDPSGAATPPAPSVPGLSRPLQDLSSEPRRYGWHATLVAPFHCKPGVDSHAVLALATDWASRQQSFTLSARVALLERFVAIQIAEPNAEDPASETTGDAAIQALAASAVRSFASLRAAPSELELAKRRKMQLSARQEALMLEWGYPFVFDEYRFHLTLSNSIEAVDAHHMLAWWERRIAALGPLRIDGVAIYVQAQPGEDFCLWQRLPFGIPKLPIDKDCR